MPSTKKDWIYFILAGFFITNAIIAELTGGKLFAIGPLNFGFFTLKEVILSVGILPWPIVFLTTDLVNEYFGKKGVQKITFVTVGLIIYCFLLLYFQTMIPTWSQSPVQGAIFSQVFTQSMWIIVGSIVAFSLSQLIDVMIFTFLKNKTGNKALWLRATGSTVISQLVDSFCIGFIAFVLPGTLSFNNFLSLATSSYIYKLMIAIAITPCLYLLHGVIDRFLEKSELS